MHLINTTSSNFFCLDHAFMYRDGDGTSFRSGKLNEFVKTLDFRWVPHQGQGSRTLVSFLFMPTNRHRPSVDP